MDITAFLEELKALTSKEDLLSVIREVNELSTKFEDYVIEEERKLQIAQLDAQDKGEPIPENDALMQGKEEFKTILREYRSQRKLQEDHKKTLESANLSRKRALIERLRETLKEENIGAAYTNFKEILEAWKEIGDIPREKRNEIQTDFSHLIEEFNYNIRIYKELKDHDFHRNKQLKEQVIQKLHELAAMENIKEVESNLKALQNEWEDIGPVKNEDWEVLKENYWSAVRSSYEKINAHYEGRRSMLLDNLGKKQDLLERITAYVNEIPKETSMKFWDKATADILAFQEEWKKIGFGPRKENEEVWMAFRAQCDRFFDQKKNYFGGLHTQYDKIADKKKELVQKAIELKDSNEWKNTATKLVQLQKQWKNLGTAGPRHEQRLWKQFRSACDVFFNSREKHFEDQEASLAGNLDAKKALIAEMEAYQLNADKNQAIADLKAFTARFNDIGHVPMKDKDAIYKGYKSILDKHYGALQLESEEKAKIMFQAKLETMAAASDPRTMYLREKADLRKRIETLEHDIIQLENNLGFFANSKGADVLKREVQKKIENARNEISAIRQKIKMIPNE